MFNLKTVMSVNHQRKILQGDVARLMEDLRKQGKQLVFTNGCFDILHAGHIQTLSQAKAAGDVLIVGVNDDASVARLKGPDRPVMPLYSRMAVLASLEYVDYVISFSEDTPLNLIQSIRPDVLVKGGDYKEEDIVGSLFVKKSGGSVKIVEQVPGISTSDIVAKIKK